MVGTPGIAFGLDQPVGGMDASRIDRTLP